MSVPFSDQLIVITGAASGIGRATALRLASQGASLILLDLTDSVESVATECRSSHPQRRDATFAVLDVRSHSACCDTLSGLLAGRRQISHVFNCAGVNPTAFALEDTTEEYFDLLMQTNVKGVYNVTKTLIPYMKQGGSFVNVSSILGLRPAKEAAIYCATKYAVIGFSKSMALELGPKGIRVNVVAPGYIRTPTNNSVRAGEEHVRQSAAKVSLGKMGEPEDVADIVTFLMSDAARYMNGSVVEVNGGIAET